MMVSPYCLRNEIHMGIAVATPDGLTVPVLRNPDQKSIKQIAIELGELGQKARDKKLSPKDLQGANFTISSLGAIGGTSVYTTCKLASSCNFGYFAGDDATGVEWRSFIHV